MTILWRHVTIFCLLGAILIVAIYDSLAAWLGGESATITDVVRDASVANYVVPALVGVIAGHLCGQYPVPFAIGFLFSVGLWNPAGQRFRDLIPPLGRSSSSS